MSTEGFDSLQRQLKLQAVADVWRTRVYAKVENIDPGQERDWYDMAFGFGLGFGLTIRESEELVSILQSEGII